MHNFLENFIFMQLPWHRLVQKWLHIKTKSTCHMDQPWVSVAVYWTSVRTLFVLQNFCNRHKIWAHWWHCWFSPQSVKMPRISSADAATLASWDLTEALKNLVPDAPFAILNVTHLSDLWSFAEIFNIIPKEAKKLPKDIMDAVVGTKSPQTKQSTSVYLWHIGTEQEKSDKEHHIQWCSRHQNKTLEHLQGWIQE